LVRSGARTNDIPNAISIKPSFGPLRSVIRTPPGEKECKPETPLRSGLRRNAHVRSIDVELGG
jgi:hypothetical protein